MGSMTEAQVAAEILKAVESAETPATVAAAVSAPAATAAVATEESPLDAAYAAIAATAEEVRARNSLTTVPFPGELNGESLRHFSAMFSFRGAKKASKSGVDSRPGRIAWRRKRGGGNGECEAARDRFSCRCSGVDPHAAAAAILLHGGER
jgi:hypothetical protein